ncbi:MAG: Rne/Rng family ribonuclease [Rhodothermales bacterium]
MGKEIVVNTEKEQTRIAILEKGDLVELYIENPENVRTIGDIYLGKVRKIMPSIRAAFVDIGQKQDAFLHFSDLADDFEYLLDFVNQDQPHVGPGSARSQKPQRKRGKRRKPQGKKGGDGSTSSDGKGRGKSNAQARGKRRQAQQRSKRGKKGRGGSGRPEKLLKRDQRILVKIVKEPISNKGSRVSTDISMAGRFLVLVPFGDYVAVSKKINSYKERRRLKALAKSLVPEGFGVIIRTVAEGKNAKTLDTDLNLLIEKWRNLEKKLAGRPNAPMVVHQDVNMLSSVMRDLFTDDYDRVLIDDEKLYRNVKSYTQAVAPQMTDAIQFHRGNQHVFEAAGVYSEIQEAFEGRVNLPGGGYLFIEHTEAMHVVDVNSGRSGRGLSQEENSLRVNLEAARAISKQIRIRDLGGIIVVDFIDLRNDNNRRKVYDELKKEFKKDRAVTKVLPMSDFGLIQITRQRMRPSITVSQSSDFLTKNGSSNGSKKAPSKPDDRKREEKKSSPPADNRKRDEERAQRTGPKTESRRSGGRGSQPAHARDASKNASVAPRAPSTAQPVADPRELVEKMEQWLVDYKTMGNRRAVTLSVHPFTAAYLNRKVPNHPTRWFMKHLVRVRLETDDTVSPLSFRFADSRSGEDLTEKVALPDS